MTLVFVTLDIYHSHQRRIHLSLHEFVDESCSPGFKIYATWWMREFGMLWDLNGVRSMDDVIKSFLWKIRSEPITWKCIDAEQGTWTQLFTVMGFGRKKKSYSVFEAEWGTRTPLFIVIGFKRKKRPHSTLPFEQFMALWEKHRTFWQTELPPSLPVTMSMQMY